MVWLKNLQWPWKEQQSVADLYFCLSELEISSQTTERAPGLLSKSPVWCSCVWLTLALAAGAVRDTSMGTEPSRASPSWHLLAGQGLLWRFKPCRTHCRTLGSVKTGPDIPISTFPGWSVEESINKGTLLCPRAAKERREAAWAWAVLLSQPKASWGRAHTKPLSSVLWGLFHCNTPQKLS